MNNINNKQLNDLVRKHSCSIAEAAEMLGLDIDVASLALASSVKERVSIEELVNECKPKCIEILFDIAQDLDVEPKDRIAACKILVQGEGVLPEINANDRTAAKLARMREIAAKVIDVPAFNYVKEEYNTQQLMVVNQ